MISIYQFNVLNFYWWNFNIACCILIYHSNLIKNNKVNINDCHFGDINLNIFKICILHQIILFLMSKLEVICKNTINY